jgi:sugar/nucleoside kinase (ribokinase family)
MHQVDVAMVGHFARDILVVDGHAVHASGGAVYYGGIAARRLGLRVAVVTRVHPGDREYLDELSAAGIQVYAADAPATSGIENVYDSADMERRVCHPLGFAGPFERGDLPDLDAHVYMIVPIMAGEVDLSLLQWMAARGPVALDVQGFVRVREADALVFKPWVHAALGLTAVTYLKADRAEAEILTGERDLLRAARALAAMGPREVVLTESAGVTVYAAGAIHRAPFTPRSLAGRTGRGDTCFATYVCKRLSASPEEACRFAAAVTTLKQEQPGPWNGDLDQVDALLTEREASSQPAGKQGR